MTSKKVTILSFDLENAVKKLNAFKRKCIKNNKSDLFFYTIGNTYNQTYRINNQYKDTTILAEVVDIELNFHTQKLIDGNFEVIARIEKIQDDNIIDLYDTKNHTYADFTNVDTTCQHCSTKRKRNFIYIIKDKATGEVKQIGKTCLNDYMQDQNALQKIQSLDAFAQIYKSIMQADEGWTGLDTDTRIKDSGIANTKHFLNVLLQIIAKHDFAKGQNVNSTYDRVYEAIAGDSEKRLFSKEELKDEVNDILNYYNDIKFTNNDFTNKLKNLLSNEYVRLADLAVLVYAYKSYLQAQQWQVKKAENASNSKHQGVVGKRETFTNLTLKNIKTIEGYYGMTYLYTFSDAEGNIFTWFASNKQNIEIEQKINILGTVKDHTEFNGTLQTQLTRCKIS